jgi:hypothetical protein
MGRGGLGRAWLARAGALEGHGGQVGLSGSSVEPLEPQPLHVNRSLLAGGQVAWPEQSHCSQLHLDMKKGNTVMETQYIRTLKCQVKVLMILM